uniref:Uncharacterized protein n=1 Tax=Oryza brachyantha TaxID=4533 RepID=J3L7J3_ORYBR
MIKRKMLVIVHTSKSLISYGFIWRLELISWGKREDDIQPHLLSYAYAYKPKFKFLILNLEWILGVLSS